jgi:hypothetical protein
VRPLDSFPAFYEPEDSLSHSQELSTCPYPEPDQSSPHHPNLSLQTEINSYLPNISDEDFEPSETIDIEEMPDEDLEGTEAGRSNVGSPLPRPLCRWFWCSYSCLPAWHLMPQSTAVLLALAQKPLWRADDQLRRQKVCLEHTTNRLWNVKGCIHWGSGPTDWSSERLKGPPVVEEIRLPVQTPSVVTIT